MPTAQSRAQATWEGDLFKGSGRVKPESGAFPELPVTWASRTQRSQGKTSPEELLATAHAACYSMALSNTLASQGTPSTRLEVSATTSFVTGEGPSRISVVDLEVRGVVPGLDQKGFEEAAKKGEQGCPVSNALRNNVEIRVKAELITG